MTFIKNKLEVRESEFLQLAASVKIFSSSNGKKYKVEAIKNEIMFFKRLDAKDANKIWEMDLKQVYNAYEELERFNTESFRKYVPIKHSPARGLLIHLKLLIQE